MNLYKVDSYWLVQAANHWEARKALGAYFDLPFEWYSGLTVEFTGLGGKIPPGLFNQPILQARELLRTNVA